MKTRTLQTRQHGPLEITTLGFGCAPLGNLYRPIQEEVAQATLDAAYDAGIRYFDTAPLYGLGLSEERVGRALARWPRDEFLLSTKIGRILTDCPPEEMPETIFHDIPSRRFDYDYGYDGVLRSYEDSLKRMGTDRVDILLVHDVDIWTHGSREASDAKIRELMEGGYKALEELRAAGDVKAIGVGINEWDICERLAKSADFDCFLLAGRYTLLEQEAQESFLPLCVERGIGIILGGPYNSGILATGPVEDAKYNYQPAPPEIMERAARLQAVCEAHGVRLVEAALHFLLNHPAIVSVIPGAAAPGEVTRNLEVLSAQVPAALWRDLKAEGLVRADSPLPESDPA
ncbi:MAG: aldo/keto reductase [Kiloniellales bacterium]|nr:aldo/keto reductase [Kiloniellales bacterium]MDJ0981139.1 aldo/keto reductase [Kiloniellales bacterium]